MRLLRILKLAEVYQRCSDSAVLRLNPGTVHTLVSTPTAVAADSRKRTMQSTAAAGSNCGQPAGYGTSEHNREADDECEDSQPLQQHVYDQCDAGAALGSSASRGDGGSGSMHHTAELGEADLAEFGRYLLDELAPGATREECLVETLASSLQRAVQREHGLPLSEPEFQPMPAAFFMDDR